MIQLWSLDCWHFSGLGSTICVEASVWTAGLSASTQTFVVSGSDDTHAPVCDVTASRPWGQRGVRGHRLLSEGTESDEVTSFWRQRGPAAVRRTWVGPQGCTASSAASLCTRRRDNAEDRPSCNLATGEGNELQVFHLKRGRGHQFNRRMDIHIEATPLRLYLSPPALGPVGWSSQGRDTSPGWRSPTAGCHNSTRRSLSCNDL